MKLQYCSDLHLEFELNEKFIRKYPLQVCGDILLLAGDIMPFSQMRKISYFLDMVSESYRQVYWVPGNHEYYHADISRRSGNLCEAIRPNVMLVNDQAIEIGDVQLICSTMWSHIDPANARQTERAMSDFHLISDNGARFSISKFNQLHQQSADFIRQTVATSKAANKIVVTHHIPTFINYPAKYAGNVISDAFAVEMSGFIETSGIHSWIYGHHHTNTPAFSIGRTQLLTNQLGYVKYGEHSLFKRATYLEV